jgi:hypothetical protein
VAIKEDTVVTAEEGAQLAETAQLEVPKKEPVKDDADTFP